MKKCIVKTISTVTALMLALCICVAAPCASAFAAQKVTEKTDSQTVKADKDDLGEIFGGFDTDFVKNLLKIDWSVFFDDEYNWDSLLSGELSFGELMQSKEWEAIVNTATGILNASVLSEKEEQQLEDIAKEKCFDISLTEITDKLADALNGNYGKFFDILNGDYSGLVDLANGNIGSLIKDFLKSDDTVGDVLNGDYTVLLNIIDGDYSYITGLLNGDYSWIKNLINGEDVDFEALFDAIDKDEINGLISVALKDDDKKVLGFIDEYYDQIKALLNNDYSFIAEIKDGEYEDMLELIKKLSNIVGFEYNENLGNVIGQLTALDDKSINNIVRTLEIMLYEALPEKYQQIMSGVSEIATKLDDVISDINDLKDTVIGLIGDLDMDNKVSMTDVVLVQRNIANIEKLDDTQLKAADINEDGKVTMSDVVLMQRVVAEI